MTHPFEVKGEVTLDATPDEVWEAIATGPGIDTWLMAATRSSRAKAAPPA